MPQAANIVINDGSATPVAVTYTPMYDSKNGVWLFLDKRLGSRENQPGFSFSFSPANPARPTDKVQQKIFLPKTKTVDGVVVPHAIGRVDINATVPTSFDATDRSNLHAILANSWTHTEVRKTIRDIEPFY